MVYKDGQGEIASQITGLKHMLIDNDRAISSPVNAEPHLGWKDRIKLIYFIKN